MSIQQLSVIILAAGKGTRMKSSQAKVLHEVFFAPMVHHVLTAVEPLDPDKTVVIVGHQQDLVKKALTSFDVLFATQEEQLGTGHAVLISSDEFDDSPGVIMILCGDTPLIRTKTLEAMITQHIEGQRDLTLLTTVLQDPSNYGRIVSDSIGNVKQIVEQKDATAEQRKICEINGGIYCVNKQFLFSALQRVGTENSQGEVYLTDIVQLAVDDGLAVGKHIAAEPVEILGVNSRLELSKAQIELQLRHNDKLMSSGVTMYNPETIRISPNTIVAKDTIIEAGVVVSGNSIIGDSCIIRQGSLIEDCTVGRSVVIGPYSHLSGQILSDNEVVPSHTVELQKNILL